MTMSLPFNSPRYNHKSPSVSPRLVSLSPSRHSPSLVSPRLISPLVAFCLVSPTLDDSPRSDSGCAPISPTSPNSTSGSNCRHKSKTTFKTVLKKAESNLLPSLSSGTEDEKHRKFRSRSENEQTLKKRILKASGDFSKQLGSNRDIGLILAEAEENTKQMKRLVSAREVVREQVR